MWAAEGRRPDMRNLEIIISTARPPASYLAQAHLESRRVDDLACFQTATTATNSRVERFMGSLFS